MRGVAKQTDAVAAIGRVGLINMPPMCVVCVRERARVRVAIDYCVCVCVTALRIGRLAKQLDLFTSARPRPPARTTGRERRASSA